MVSENFRQEDGRLLITCLSLSKSHSALITEIAKETGIDEASVVKVLIEEALTSRDHAKASLSARARQGSL